MCVREKEKNYSRETIANLSMYSTRRVVLILEKTLDTRERKKKKKRKKEMEMEQSFVSLVQYAPCAIERRKTLLSAIDIYILWMDGGGKRRGNEGEGGMAG